MNAEDKNLATEIDLNRLEERVDELIRIITKLQDENQSLRGTQQGLLTERTELIEKTEQAKSRVEAMITRLKSIETG